MTVIGGGSFSSLFNFLEGLGQHDRITQVILHFTLNPPQCFIHKDHRKMYKSMLTAHMKEKKSGTLILGFLVMIVFLASPAFAAAPLDPTTIPKFVTQIEPLPHWLPTEVGGVDTSMRSTLLSSRNQFCRRHSAHQIVPDPVLRPNSGTVGWQRIILTTSPLGLIRHAPSATFEATRNKPVQVKWINNLGTNSSPVCSGSHPALGRSERDLHH